MSIYKIITENQLDNWVRGNAKEAQGLIVELVYRLVAASSQNPKERRFPLGDSIGQTGSDGFLDTDFKFEPFVPEGKSYWEIGTGIDQQKKATKDYKDLTKTTTENERKSSTFIFVTPLSAVKGWKAGSQEKWLKKRISKKEWGNLKIIDGTRLTDWLHHFPAVEKWLANVMKLGVKNLETPEERWEVLKLIGEPPPLSTEVFITNRKDACLKLDEVFNGNFLRLKIDTKFPHQMADFVSAYLASLDQEKKKDILGRTLIISDYETWENIIELKERHIFIADFDLNDTDSKGIRLLEKAQRKGHAIIFGGMPGGVPNPNRVELYNPKPFQLQKALENTGYKEERARILAQKSNGNIETLLRCLQNISLVPEWAESSRASDLVIAELLGSWNENNEADKKIIEELSGKEYGEWIGSMQEVTQIPNSPLTKKENVWKFVSRYEGWYTLGPKIFDGLLENFMKVSVNVLKERDPKFDLPPEEHYQASIHGKILEHSNQLRNGLAESLALLGSYPEALTSCSTGKGELMANKTVREILRDTDWILWGSINDLLPLLAEASPEEFLNAVEKILSDDSSTFKNLFEIERAGFGGRNYLTGLLWALETLAWDETYLIRTIVILGELANVDPGGNWANRPSNSLSTILLPWMPQTTASVEKRKTAVATLLDENQNVAWDLLLSLLPQKHQVSNGARRPAWREFIPESWSRSISRKEYHDQIFGYSELAVKIVKNDLSKLPDLLERLDDLPPSAFEQILDFLSSEQILNLPENDQQTIWSKLIDIVTKHRRYSDAEWAMQSSLVDKINDVAKSLTPSSPFYTHKRLFSKREFELYDEKGNYEEQRQKIDEQRENAIEEIFNSGGLSKIITFLEQIETPFKVGFALGSNQKIDVDQELLPSYLKTVDDFISEFIRGFIIGRFHNKGWEWVDQLELSKWNVSEKGGFYSYLPFSDETWSRVKKQLGKDESIYWSKTSINPYDAKDNLEFAVKKLLEYSRPSSALRCLKLKIFEKEPFNHQLAIDALDALLTTEEKTRSIDSYDIVETIKFLQEVDDIEHDDLFRIEWAYLKLLDRHSGGYPKLLEQRLANDPEFFCEIISLVYKSKLEDPPKNDSSDEKKNIAQNAFHLLWNWKTPPGSKEDSSFDGEHLKKWYKEVREITGKTGHLEVALQTLGQVLINVSNDPDGLWIDKSAGEILNKKDADEVRKGYYTALINSRGVYFNTAGKEELELAKSYKQKADEVESHGFHRLAKTLRDLAKSYEREAEREANSDPYDF